MNPEQTGSPEDRFDSALQRVIEGSPVEDVMAGYGFLEGEEAEALLRAAGSLRQGPHPELPPASLAAMVARAQSQARMQSQARPLAVDGFRDEEAPALLPSAVPAPRPAQHGPVTTRAGLSWTSRFAGLFRRPAPALRLAWALALVLALYAGVLTFARINNQSPILPVPTFSGVPFYYDAAIQQIGTSRWTIGGYQIEIDKSTRITGDPVVGASAHVEGQVLPGNRRIAKSIKIIASPPLTPTVVGQATATPTGLAEISGGPLPTAWESRSPTLALTPASGDLPITRTIVNTSTTEPAPATPTRATSSTPTPGRAGAGILATTTATATRTTVRQATPTRTFTPRPTNTAVATATHSATPIPTLTATHTPVPTRTSTPVLTFTPSSTAQASPAFSPTAEPEETATLEPTSEPEDTETPEATDTPAPALTSTPRLTRTPYISPTRVPSRTPTEEPTHKPEETETVPVSTRTPEATQTHEPDETHTPHPEETQGPESTHAPEPSPTH